MKSEGKSYHELAEEIFIAGVDAVKPGRLIKECMRVRGSDLIFNGSSINLDGLNNIYVIGAGKASAAMALAVEEILGSRIKGGLVVVKYGHAVKLATAEVVEAGHPLPDLRGFEATLRIRRIVEEAVEDDLIICLISGGGSSLLADCPLSAAPEDIIKMNDLLVKSGADINEVNTVRKHLSCIKGGQMAKLAYPARTLCLMISDVPGDDPGVIASGPFEPDRSTFRDALEVIDKYDLRKTLPSTLLENLMNGIKGIITETPKHGDPVFSNVKSIVAGNNTTALEAAASYSRGLGLTTLTESGGISMQIEKAARKITETAQRYKKDEGLSKPACILIGGEPVLKVNGNGTGGRNQHLALLCARSVRGMEGITILCAGTDGTDGPTNAAGAVIDNHTWTDAVMNRIDPASYLDDYDSFNFFREAGGHVITGPTLTNVMDMVVILL